MSLLAAQKLGKQYGARFLFRDAEFTLAEGVRVGLIGANGTGKTSLFRIILGDDDHEGPMATRPAKPSSPPTPRSPRSSTRSARSTTASSTPRATKPTDCSRGCRTS